jgi:hypothetical protein
LHDANSNGLREGDQGKKPCELLIDIVGYPKRRSCVGPAWSITMASEDLVLQNSYAATYQKQVEGDTGEDWMF